MLASLVVVIVFVAPPLLIVVLSLASVCGVSNNRCGWSRFSGHDDGFTIEQALMEFSVGDGGISAMDSINLRFVVFTKTCKYPLSEILMIHWFAQESKVSIF